MAEIENSNNFPPSAEAYLSTNSFLGRKLGHLLGEKEIQQKGTFSREEWLKRLDEAFKKDTGITLFILDIVGGGRLSDEGIFSDRLQAVMETITSTFKTNQNNSTTGITEGRHSEAISQERVAGSDELLFFLSKRLTREEIQNKIEKLKKELEGKVRQKNSVYIGVCSAPARSSNKINDILRGADSALAIAKKRAKEEKDFSPQIIEIDNAGKTLLNGKFFEIKRENAASSLLPPEVRTRNIIPEIREKAKRGQFFTLISPQKMKEINAKKGVEGGDAVLAKVAEMIISALKQKQETLPVVIYKIGTIFLVEKKIPLEIIKMIAFSLNQQFDSEDAYQGLEYDYYPHPPKNS